MRFNRRFFLVFLLLPAFLVACSPPAPTFKTMDISGVEWGGDFTLFGLTFPGTIIFEKDMFARPRLNRRIESDSAVITVL